MLLAARTLALLLCAAPALAQEPPAAKVRWVDGRPMLQAKLRAGEVTYICHLLLDLSHDGAMLLHRNAAGSLAASAADVEIGTIKLASVPFTGRRDRFLEGLTARYATELQEIPVAGYLGLASIQGGAPSARFLVLDGPDSKLTLHESLPEDALANAIACEGATVMLELGAAKRVRCALATRDPFSFLAQELLPHAGTAAVGGLALATITPFRPQRGAGGVEAGIGGRVLEQLATTMDLTGKRVRFERRREDPFPADEQALCDALVNGDDALERLVRDTARGAVRAEAASVLFAREKDKTPPNVERLSACGDALLQSAKDDRRASTALRFLADLPREAATTALREQIASAALPAARTDIDGTAQHALRLELGRIQHARGELAPAYRNLLAAAFGMPANGEASLALGELHLARGERERAQARFFQAMLDAKNTGERGYAALAALWTAQHGSAAGLSAEVKSLAEGRVPGFHPVPRAASEITKTGKVVLLEMFTGAQCPPCAGADAALDALLEHYARDEVAVLVWHLPIPAPEPMVTDLGHARAQRYGVRGTPTLVMDGGEKIVGGGKASDAPAIFTKYEKALTPLLAKKPSVTIRAKSERRAGMIALHATVEGAPEGALLHAVLCEKELLWPGRNGIVFHTQVVRAAFTPENGMPAREPLAIALQVAKMQEQLALAVGAIEPPDAPFLVRPTTLSHELCVVLFVTSGEGAALQALTIDVPGGER